MNFNEEMERIFPNGFSVRDEANALTCMCFRNGPLEDLHAGKHSETLEDPSYSRITDPEMKELMIYASRKLEELLLLKESDPRKYLSVVIKQAYMYTQGWER